MPAREHYRWRSRVIAGLGFVLGFVLGVAALLNVLTQMHTSGGGGKTFESQILVKKQSVANPACADSFRVRMRAIQWQLLTNVPTEESSSLELDQYKWEMDHLVNLLVDFNIQESKVPIRTDCHAPALVDPAAIDCSAYPKAFDPNLKRTTAAKIGHAIQLGYDADSLEVFLHEVYDLVDYFFILEWTLPHYIRLTRKTLIWDKLKTQERFLPFQKKIVHLVMDDLDTARINHQAAAGTDFLELFKHEHYQERVRWQKIVEWNALEQAFGPDDLIGFGDADEVPSRDNLQLLKYCYIRGGQRLDVGIWFPFGRVDQAFRTDHPVRGYKYSLGDPTYWTFQAATDYPGPGFPTRMRGKSPAFLLGGMHMSHYGFLPFMLLKLLTCSECDIGFTLRDVQSMVRDEAWLQMEVKYGATPDSILSRTQKVANLSAHDRAPIVLPWFYACNPDRYPVWESSHHDTRLE